METINLNEKAKEIMEKTEKIIEDIKQLKVVTYDEVLQKGNEQPLLDCIEIDTGVFAYNAGQDLSIAGRDIFIMQDLNVGYIERYTKHYLMDYISWVLKRKTVLKRFIQKLKYAKALFKSNSYDYDYDYNSLFEAIANYLNINLKKKTDYKNDDNWVKIYDFLDKYREKTDDELIDIFKFCDDCMIDLTDWYDEEIINPTNEEIIKATRVALRKMYSQIRCVMRYYYRTDFGRFVTKVLRETVGDDVLCY